MINNTWPSVICLQHYCHYVVFLDEINSVLSLTCAFSIFEVYKMTLWTTIDSALLIEQLSESEMRCDCSFCWY